MGAFLTFGLPTCNFHRYLNDVSARSVFAAMAEQMKSKPVYIVSRPESAEMTVVDLVEELAQTASHNGGDKMKNKESSSSVELSAMASKYSIADPQMERPGVPM